MTLIGVRESRGFGWLCALAEVYEVISFPMWMAYGFRLASSEGWPWWSFLALVAGMLFRIMLMYLFWRGWAGSNANVFWPEGRNDGEESS
jgi:hypothetical protein